MIDEGNALEEQGRIAEAMARYDAAAQTDPLSARAHLNRGNVLLARNEVEAARNAYQLAISCDPLYAAAHFNLGNLNYRFREFDDALRNYQVAIDLKPEFADAFVAMANVLEGLGRTDEAVRCFERALTFNRGYAEVHFSLGMIAMRHGRHNDAKNALCAALEIRPDNASAHYYLGHVLHALGSSDQALESLRQCVRIEPAMHDAHYGMGFILQSLRPHPRQEEAVFSLRRATEINPDFAQAHRLLGVVLSNLGQLEAAETCLRRALSLDPDSADTLYDLAMTLLTLGRSAEALSLIVPTLARSPTWTTQLAFVTCIACTRFAVNDPQIRAALTSAITESWGAPCELVGSALNLLMLDRRIAGYVRLANESWHARLPKVVLFGEGGLTSLATDPLLLALLKSAPVTTMEFERFLTCARYTLLETASSARAPGTSDIVGLQFYSALAQQCFVNEYIFDCDERERRAAGACRTKLLSLLDANEVVPPLLLLAVATYFPLYTLPEPGRLLTANAPSPVDEVLRQQIREPLEEQALRVDLDRLTSITSGISQDVREQYEQNPYPRWVKLPKCDHARRFNDQLARMLPFASFVPMPDDSAPEVLIAGCGTGSHPIFVAQRYDGAKVTAIDLSLSSLSYAKRKTRELGIANLEYAQADILKLGDITRTFDVIESVGVLHHLSEPFIGWRILLSRLRPGGFMRLGFYSEIARRPVVTAREMIASRGYASTPEDIRRFRQDASVELQWLKDSGDFFSTSACRDLLFHIQEHRLTLGQIESFLGETGLHFIGFFNLDARVQNQYRARFPDDPSRTHLRNWAQFEADNPDTFASMYNFWIQKPI
jgi:tetratricopeptide (TPR) repeat protein/SAM-dependent methyltransferase